MRPTDVPDQGLLCDLLWSDPDKDTMGWGENDRGVSFTFGAEVSVTFDNILRHMDQLFFCPIVTDCGQISSETRFRFDLSCSSSC